MELGYLQKLARKWAWLVLLAVGIASLSTYWFSRNQPPTYVSTVTLIIGQVMNNPNPTGSDLETMNQLARSYSLILQQQPVLQATIDTLGLPVDWEGLAFRLNTFAPGGQLLQISVTDNNPQQAQRIANELARQLILTSPTGDLQIKTVEQRRFVTDQMTSLQLQIESNQKSLDTLNNQAALENNPQKLADLAVRITALQTKISDWQRTYGSLGALLNISYSNFLAVVTPATVPTSPSGPDVRRNVLFAAVVGLLLAVGAIVLLEYLDDSVKTAEEIRRLRTVTLLGAVGKLPRIHKPGDALVAWHQPNSENAEALRVMRTHLRNAELENAAGALLITSPSRKEGRSTFAANLAITLAQSGRRVILIDGDLRNPMQHQLFGLDNETGLANLLTDLRAAPENELRSVDVDCLRLMTSGTLPSNPADLLESERMGELITDLRSRSDVVILDAPALLNVADASILAKYSTGAILVVQAGRTRRVLFHRALESLAETGVRVFGIVLNQANERA